MQHIRPDLARNLQQPGLGGLHQGPLVDHRQARQWRPRRWRAIEVQSIHRLFQQASVCPGCQAMLGAGQVESLPSQSPLPSQ